MTGATPHYEVRGQGPRAHRAHAGHVPHTGAHAGDGRVRRGSEKDGDTTEPKTEIKLPPYAAAWAEPTTANLPYFVGRIVPGFMSYAPDIHRLEALSDRLVLACARTHAASCPTVRPLSWPSVSARNSSTSQAGTPP